MANENLPCVTIFTLVYNTGPFVIKAIESVVANGYPNIQHIIIDDFSTDRSAELVQQWISDHHYACEFIRHEKNMGICRSINDALARARGKYAFGISDDLIEPDRIRHQVELMESLGPEVGAVYSDVWLLRDEKRLSKTFMENFNPGFIENMPQGNLTIPILQGFYVPGMSVMIRKECFDTVGLFDETLEVEDADMWIRISEKYSFCFDRKVVATYRLHDKAFTVINKIRIYRSFFMMFQKYFGRNHSHDRWWRVKLVEIAENYYSNGGDGSAKWLLYCFSRTGNIYSLYFAVSAALGISHRNAITFFGLRKRA